MGVKKPKIITPIEDGVNRRFFQAIEALVSLGRLSALESFCKEAIFKALLGAFLLSPLKQFAEEGGYSRKYLRLPKKEKGNRQ